jgi:tRNA (mo5U34)-methyltransferase
MAASGFEYIQKWHAVRLEKGFWHSFELPNGTRIEGANSVESQRRRLGQFPIPEDLRGKRVLDIGCWDGWYSFEMERRGAQVVAVDCWENPRFRQVHAALQSQVDYRILDMYELTPERVGLFDIVLFMGVLYHLKHPLLALERVCALSTDLAVVESFILRPEQLPGMDGRRAILEFYETSEMGGQTDNWFGPSLPALLGMCRVAGFARVELCAVLDYGACVMCFRRWEKPGGTTQAPRLETALHAVNGGVNFRSGMDEYAAIWFHAAGAVGTEEVKPEVAGYGVRPISVTNMGEDVWQVNFKLPPVDRAGWQEARVRLRDSEPSNATLIAVDLPLDVSQARLCSVCDAATWKAGELDQGKGAAVSFWLEGLPENADLNNIRATLGGQRLRTMYLEPAGGKGPGRQVNVCLMEELTPGSNGLVVTVGERVVGEIIVEVKGQL